MFCFILANEYSYNIVAAEELDVGCFVALLLQGRLVFQVSADEKIDKDPRKLAWYS